MKIRAQGFVTVLTTICVACAPATDAEPGGERQAGAEQPAELAGADTGTATVYAGMLEGGETAGGEAFNHEQLVAAHRTIGIGSRVRVTNLENNRSVTVEIVDRTPADTEAVIDLSRRAASELGMKERDRARVRVELLD